MNAGRQDAGEHDIEWNGKDNSGNTVNDGTYTFEIEAVGEMGQAVSSNTHVMGEVTGITYESDMPYLMIRDKLVSPSEIMEVQLTNKPMIND
jgi:flagellar basal-body rod modification protein FlgD